MPKVELRELTPQEQALAARVGELLRGAKPGETVTLPPDLAQALDDAARSAAAPAIIARRRLEWLHSRDACNVDGYEWGIFRVKWENGRAVEVWQTNADFSDLDAAMVAAGVKGPLAGQRQEEPLIEGRTEAEWCREARRIGAYDCVGPDGKQIRTFTGERTDEKVAATVRGLKEQAERYDRTNGVEGTPK